jgi:signal transduction histidine kinase
VDGSGLGLAFVKAVAEKHGGRVAVESVPGRGSRFTLWIPAAPMPPAQPPAADVGVVADS